MGNYTGNAEQKLQEAINSADLLLDKLQKNTLDPKFLSAGLKNIKDSLEKAQFFLEIS